MFKKNNYGERRTEKTIGGTDASLQKMIEKYPPDEIPGIDKSQIEQLKLFFANYDEMKDNITIEMLGPFNNDMTKKLIPIMISRLKEQLGDDGDDIEVKRDSVVDAKEKEFLALPTEDRYVALIDAIDNELKNPNLSMEEIDELLDRRSKIQNSLSK